MSMVISQESAEAKERAKWEMFPTQYGAPGRPFKQQEFPKCMYVGGHDATGRQAVLYEQMVLAENANHEAELKERGYCARQEDALDRVKRQDLEIATAAAEENFRIRRMGEQAQREATAIIDAAGEHLPEVPVTPIKPRGRPKKVATALPSEG